MPVKVTNTNCLNLRVSCDYTPGNEAKRVLAPNSCANQAYQKLSGIAKNLSKHEVDKFGGKGFLTLNISDARGGTIGEISVMATEEGSEAAPSRRGVPCNVSGVTSDCYADKFKVSPTLPKPDTVYNQAACKQVLDQITEDTVFTLLDNYHGHISNSAKVSDRSSTSRKSTQSTGGTPTSGGNTDAAASNPNHP